MNKLLKLLSVALLAGLAVLDTQAQAWTITVSGTIDSENPVFGQPGYASPFGMPGESLVGASYTMTITTDPSLNSFVESSTSTLHITYGGTSTDKGPAAPYTIKVTVNGVTFIQTEPIPAYNSSYLQSLRQPNFMDQVFQEVKSNACTWAYGLCIDSYILAYSVSTGFLRNVDFNQTVTVPVPGRLDPDSRVYFAFRTGPYDPGSFQQFSTLYGNISKLSINVGHNE